MKEFERYLKALIEAYGTMEGKPLNLDDETVLKIGKKLRFLIANETIEEEIPNDLEEAAEKYATEWHENPDGSAWKPYFEVSAIKAFIAGAKWQKEQDAELIEIAYNDGITIGMTKQKEQDDKELSDLLTIAHLQGADQMKEQMLKEAVDAIVENWNPDPEPEITIPLNPEEFTCGDKVRVFIIKE